MIKKWKLLEEKEVLMTKNLKVYRDKVELHDGKIIEDYYRIDMGYGAMVVGVTEEGKIIIIKQYRHGAGEALWEFPAGHVEEGEEAVEGARREFEEETGYKAGEYKSLGTMWNNAGKNMGRVSVYLATSCTKKGEGEDNKEINEVDWDEIEKMILEGKICESISVAAWMLARKFV